MGFPLLALCTALQVQTGEHPRAGSSCMFSCMRFGAAVSGQSDKAGPSAASIGMSLVVQGEVCASEVLARRKTKTETECAEICRCDQPRSTDCRLTNVTRAACTRAAVSSRSGGIAIRGSASCTIDARLRGPRPPSLASTRLRHALRSPHRHLYSSHIRSSSFLSCRPTRASS